MIATLPVIALFAFGFTRNPSEIPSPLPGNAAPSFTLPVFAPGEAPLARPVGDTIRLADQGGKVVVVNFWASWCLACRDEHTALSETAREYANTAEFVGVLYNDRPEAGVRWISQMGGQSYPSVIDNSSRTAIDYGLYGVPETFIIDPAGRIAYKHIGPISAATLRQKIDSLLPRGAAGIDVPKADTMR
ncbi:MAG TPA: redoxin domain-containing protein [Gemmatimonadaceae bacterium]|nr:redoxin domain-containing protein [Gemmatimonadaceae bacterium]